jgi:hypothetical protein
MREARAEKARKIRRNAIGFIGGVIGGGIGYLIIVGIGNWFHGGWISGVVIGFIGFLIFMVIGFIISWIGNTDICYIIGGVIGIVIGIALRDLRISGIIGSGLGLWGSSSNSSSNNGV